MEHRLAIFSEKTVMQKYKLGSVQKKDRYAIGQAMGEMKEREEII